MTAAQLPLIATLPLLAAALAVLVRRPATPSSFTEEGVRAAYAAHGAELYRFALRGLGDAGLAQDAVQETFLRAWRARERYDPSVAALRTWLFGIARNVVVDLHRVREARPWLRDLADHEAGGADLAPARKLRRRRGVDILLNVGALRDHAEQAGVLKVVADDAGHLRADRIALEIDDGDRHRLEGGPRHVDRELRTRRHCGSGCKRNATHHGQSSGKLHIEPRLLGRLYSVRGSNSRADRS